MMDRRITVMWLSGPNAKSALPDDEPPLNRQQRRQWAAIEKQLFAQTGHWPRFKCENGHVAAVDPEIAAEFRGKPCEHCGTPLHSVDS